MEPSSLCIYHTKNQPKWMRDEKMQPFEVGGVVFTENSQSNSS